MRRRQDVGPLSTLPERLSRYLRDEWGDDPQAWYDARDVYIESGGELPFLSGSECPDVPFDAGAL